MRDQIKFALSLSTIGAMGIAVSGYLIFEVMQLHGFDGSLPMVAGLLSKIGHIVALRYINDSVEYSKIPVLVVGKIVDEMGPSLGLVLLQKWDLPIDVIDCIYGDATGSYDPPMTRRDVFEITKLYLEFIRHDTEHLPVFDKIDNILIQYSHEFNDLLSATN